MSVPRVWLAPGVPGWFGELRELWFGSGGSVAWRFAALDLC